MRWSQDVQAAVDILHLCNCYENDVAKLWLWGRLLRWQSPPTIEETWFCSGYREKTTFHANPQTDVELRYAEACAKFEAIRMHGAARIKRLAKLAFGPEPITAMAAGAPGREVA